MTTEESPLVLSIERLANFMRNHNETRWAEELDRDAAWIRRGDAYGIERFLGLFGGMGSLNDVAFTPMNRNAADAEEAARLNDTFESLRGEAWRLAKKARHDLTS